MTLPTTALLASQSANVVSYIQLAVAPVFLLTGVGSMLAVLTNRLARIIDRARAMEDRYQSSVDADVRRRLHADLKVLSQRSRLVSRAIGFCTACSLFVSLVIAILFVQSLFEVYLHGVVPLLFIIAMGAFIVGLLLFLREIQIATAALRIGPPDDEAS
ncbi:MAG TPA: DUF2721 domain-containing protein [Moraxellaceae bacterium]|nr:DUF2721 domain-containing protein [Moraxellaceae bacterium]